jgi:lipase chaperone LimK
MVMEKDLVIPEHPVVVSGVNNETSEYRDLIDWFPFAVGDNNLDGLFF